jgi:hypothetical protein
MTNKQLIGRLRRALKHVYSGKMLFGNFPNGNGFLVEKSPITTIFVSYPN